MHSSVRLRFIIALLSMAVSAAWSAAPTISSTSPTTNKLNVTATSNITVTFDQSMTNETLSPTNIKVHGNYRGFYSAAFSVTGNTVTIDPDSSFKAGEVITVSVTTGVLNSITEPMASPRVFSFTVDAPAGYSKFRTPDNYTAYGSGSGNHYSTLADLDKDGDIDIASTTSLYNKMSVMLNNGNGSYASAVTYTTLNAFDISAADVDGDGDMDLVVANNSAYGMSVFINNGSGGFATRNDFSFSFPQSNAQFLVPVDIDGDGDIDVVTNDLTYNYLHIMKNNGSGSFTATDKEFTTKFGALSAGDLDKDGDMDILAACATVDSVEQMNNDGAGNLNMATRYYWTSTDGPTATLIADINSTFGDKQDLVWLNGPTDLLTYFKDGSGIPLFTADNVSVGEYPSQVSAVDVDTDSDLDLVVANYNDQTFSVLTNTGSGTGTFSQTTYTVPSYPDDLSTADIDGDGDMDIVTIHNDATVSVFKNYNGGHVSSVTPVNGALDIALSSDITLVFDENINSATLTASTVKIAGSVSGNHSWTLSSYNSGTNTATINPAADFVPGEVVTITVTSGVQNSNAVALEYGFSSAFVTATQAAGVLGAKTDYTTGDQPQSVVVADLDADGDADIVAANYLSDDVSVFINNGSGTFAAKVDYAVGDAPTSVAVGDVDGDGDQDIVAALNGANQLGRLLNSGSGTFGSVTTYGTSTGPNALALVDLDRDGDLDVVYTLASQTASQQNNGSGVFSNEWTWNSGDKAITTADVDNDGDRDVLAVSYSGFNPRVYVYRNTYSSGYGYGYLGTYANYTVDADPTGVVAADFNNDGYVDIVTTNLHSGSGTINYLANNMDGTFAAKVSYTVAVNAQPRGVTAVDVDSDGDLDLAVANGAADSIVFFTNNGSGVFSKSGQFAAGDNPSAIASADHDADGDADVFTANAASDNISVVKATTAVSVSSVVPAAFDLDISAVSNIVVTFNQSMNPSTLNSSTVRIVGSQRGAYSAAYGHAAGVLTVNPDDPFLPGEMVTVLVNTGVQNVDGASLAAPKQWSFIVSASPNDVFGARQEYSTIDGPQHIDAADMDGDGDIDAVTANGYQKTVSVLLNNGSGVLGAADTSYTGATNNSRFIVLSDFDNDGDIDVATANQSSSSFSVLMNNGDATLADPVVYSFTDPYPTIAAADLNYDGYTDLILCKYNTNQAVVYLNDGDGTFTAQSLLATGTGPWGVGTGDVDGDGDIDFVTADYDGTTISIFLNNGNGTFATANSIASGISYPDGIAINDLNGDGDADIVVSSWDNGQLAVLLNSGSGSFTTPVAYTNVSTSQVKLGDVDGDGDLDIVSSEPSSKVYVRTNNGSGTFSALAMYSAGSYPQSVALADMDADGDLDILTANNGNSKVSILKNVELVAVSSTVPAANAYGVNKNTNITVTFNEAMSVSTLVDSNIVVHGSLSGKIAGAITYDGPSKTLTFNPTDDFVNGEVVTVTVQSHVMADVGVNLHRPFSRSFTVGTTGNGNFVFADSAADYLYNFATINWLNAGDVTGDGVPDLVTAYNNAIKVFENTHPGFDSISTVAVDYTQSMPMADLDNDGDMDILQSNFSSAQIRAISNNGSGVFTAQSPYTTSANNSPKAVLADMDNDGRADVMVNGSGSQQVYIYYDDGRNLSFSGAYSYMTIHYDIKDYLAADVDNDGLKDVVTLHSGNGNNFVTISRNTGDRSYATPVDYTIDVGGTKITSVDVDQDGDLDMVVGNSDGKFFSVLKNNGDGTFAAAVSYNIGMSIHQMETADVDGDDDQDLVIRGEAYNAVWDGDQAKIIIAYNNGTGTFNNQFAINNKSDAPDYYYAYSNLVMMDYDSDGDLDIAVKAYHYFGSDQYSNILFFANTTGSSSAPTTAASAITFSNNYGTSVKISWTNGNGGRRLVLIKSGSAVNTIPSNNGNFQPAMQFGSGTNLNTGNYVVYGGVGNSVTVTGLSVNTPYHVAVFEMNGIPGSEQVMTTSAPTGSFTTNAIEGLPFATSAGKSVYFTDGWSSQVNLPVTTVPKTLTAEMWVKADNSTSTSAFFTRGAGSGGGGGGYGSVVSSPIDHVASSTAGQGANDNATAVSAAAKRSGGNRARHAAKAAINGDADSNFPIHIGVTNGHFYLSVYDDNNGEAITVTGTTAVNAMQWYHVAMTMDNDDQYPYALTVKLYVNGVLDASFTGADVYFYDYGDAFVLGYDGNAYFAGSIDEVRIFNSVKTASQIRSTMHRTLSGFPTGMEGYWQFEEGSGITSGNIVSNINAELVNIEWENSSAPVGYGSSASTSSFSTGTAAVGNASLTMSDGFDNPVDVVVTEVTSAPNQWPAGYSANVGGKVFVIELFGDPGTFNASLTLNFGANVVPLEAEGTPGILKLFRRSSTSDGSWTDLGSAVSANRATGNVTWNNITSFSQFMVGNENAMPVELTTFNASARGSNVELRWNTATESNNHGFEVERKNGGEWVNIGFMQGAGNSNAPVEYTFTDTKLKRGSYAYRLKQVDRNGRFAYSPMVEVTVGGVPMVFALDQNYPNPFNPSTTFGFTLQNTGLTSLKVYNMVGQEVATLVNEVLEAGVYHQKVFDARNLASGVYFARLVSGNQTQMKKILLMK